MCFPDRLYSCPLRGLEYLKGLRGIFRDALRLDARHTSDYPIGAREGLKQATA